MAKPNETLKKAVEAHSRVLGIKREKGSTANADVPSQSSDKRGNADGRRDT